LARPKKLTQDLQDRLCALIARGHYATTACHAVGLGEATYFRWMELGTDHLEKDADGGRKKVAGRSPYLEFREAVQKAQANAQMAHMEAIREAAFEVVAGPDGAQRVRCKNWTASAWFLERTRPDLFGRRDVVHVAEGQQAKKPDEKGGKKVVRFGGRFKPDGSLQTSALLPSARDGE